MTEMLIVAVLVAMAVAVAAEFRRRDAKRTVQARRAAMAIRPRSNVVRLVDARRTQQFWNYEVDGDR